MISNFLLIIDIQCLSKILNGLYKIFFKLKNHNYEIAFNISSRD